MMIFQIEAVEVCEGMVHNYGYQVRIIIIVLVIVYIIINKLSISMAIISI